MLAPKSRRALDTFPMEHGMVTFPGSLSLCGSFLWITALQLPSTTMLSLLIYFPFFVRKFFRNLVYEGIWCKTSLKGMVIYNLLKMSRKQAKYHSLSLLDDTKGYGAFFTRTEGFSFLASWANWLLVLVLVVETSLPLSLLLSYSPSSFFFFSPSSSLASSLILFSFLALSFLVKITLHSSLRFLPMLAQRF